MHPNGTIPKGAYRDDSRKAPARHAARRDQWSAAKGFAGMAPTAYMHAAMAWIAHDR